uniref:CCHC-type domain-containing protein n=1 Tax=Tanacetum cinerariifolium TaxID=118510 RepID=A0A6L2JEV6_TANCI|nr:hypothetical protein [Tanacetum cinerariifolium]
MIAAITGVANVVVEAPRPKRDEEFTAEENARDLADIQASSILSQGVPRHIFNTLNQTESAKEMWENIKLLMKGSGLSEQCKQEELFDEYECFRAIGNESIHEYFIRFHKLANDPKITKIKIPTHQHNTKFLNNLPSYWAKYVTSVKQNQYISTKSYVELYTYLKAYEPYALKTLKKQEQSSSSVDPLAYLAPSLKHQTSTTVALPTSTSSSTLAPEQQAQSGSDAMMAITQQLVNLLSGFQKQFPPMNNQLRTSSNPRNTKGNQGYGKKTDRNGKKVICYNCRGEGHVARECKEPKRPKDTQYYKDKMMLSDAKDRGVILDAEAEAFLADVECTKPYNESLALTTTTAFQFSHEDAYDFDIDDGPHAAAAFMENLSSTEEANGYIKTNKDLSQANESLKAKLAQCKLEMQILECNKVKHDLDQAIVDRNKGNTDLEQENLLLKTTLFNKKESIKALNEKNNKVVSEKKDLDERNLEGIVCLQKANKVMSDLLKTYQQPTYTIPMLSKRPNIATSDLHKTALGSSNPKYGNIARESHPAIYDGNRLVDPTHVPSFVWEIEETITLGAENKAKMFEKQGTVKPINYDVLNNSYIKFVPQKVLSREQVYWQSASAVKAPFVHTRLAKSEVFSLIRSLKLLFPGLDPIIFQHTKNKHPLVSHECFNHTQYAIETQFLPFLNMFKKLVYQFEEVLVKEVKEFEKIFDEYEQGVKKIKSLEITNRNLVREIECLTSDSIANDVCAIVRTVDVRMPLDVDISSSCVRELSKGLELEAEIAKKNKMLFESEKRCSHIEKYYIDLEIKFQEYKYCFGRPNVCDNSQSPAYNAFFEINKLKDQLQGKDITIKQLQTQLKDVTVVQVGPTARSLDKQALETEITQLKDKLTSINIQLNGYKIENQTLSNQYEELAKSNMSSRAQLTGRITALITENANLKAGVKGKQNSRPTQPEKPKVLTPGMFAICTKYIPPPRRENWVAPAPKPRKKQATFREPPRPSHSTTQKIVVQQNKKRNIYVNLSTGVKPATRASKPMSKSAT